MDNTIASLVQGSSLPLSVLIIGVYALFFLVFTNNDWFVCLSGPADFADMNKLDADVEPLQWQGKRAEVYRHFFPFLSCFCLFRRGFCCSQRDIVQFVPMRDYDRKPFALLAKDTLAEIPTQVLSYMKSRGP